MVFCAFRFCLTILFPLEQSRCADVTRSLPALSPLHDVLPGELLSLFQQWYNSSMNVICTWLTDRMDLQLHIYQLKTLIRMVKVKEQSRLLCQQPAARHFTGGLQDSPAQIVPVYIHNRQHCMQGRPTEFLHGAC